MQNLPPTKLAVVVVVVVAAHLNGEKRARFCRSRTGWRARPPGLSVEGDQEILREEGKKCPRSDQINKSQGERERELQGAGKISSLPMLAGRC